MSNIPDLNR